MNLLAIVNSKCAAFVSECVHGIRFVNAMHLLAMQSSVDWRHCSIASRSTLKIKFRMRFPVTTVYRRAIYLKILSWFVGIKSISFAKSKILSNRAFRSFRGINQSSSNRLSRYVHIALLMLFRNESLKKYGYFWLPCWNIFSVSYIAVVSVKSHRIYFRSECHGKCFTSMPIEQMEISWKKKKKLNIHDRFTVCVTISIHKHRCNKFSRSIYRIFFSEK